MNRLSILLALGIFVFMAGCSSVNVYKFEKDRVDQKLAGNKGYVEGDESAEPATERKTKRTLIGVDIDLTTLFERGDVDSRDMYETDEETHDIVNDTRDLEENHTQRLPERRAEVVAPASESFIVEEKEDWIK